MNNNTAIKSSKVILLKVENEQVPVGSKLPVESPGVGDSGLH